MFGSQLKHLEEMSNDTGTFAIGKESRGSTLARESKERSLIKTRGEAEGMVNLTSFKGLTGVVMVYRSA
jgi:hypothetical protein